ncbi:MAG: alpha/beta fold hydrolase [Acidimicrobiales bacterium]
MSGLPVIMLPGSLCDERVFAAQVDALDADVSVADLTRFDTIPALAAAVLASAPPRFLLAGLSLGGIVATEIARVAADRLAGLALLDTNLGPAPNQQLELRDRWAQDTRAGHFTTAVAEAFVDQLTADAPSNGELIFEMAMAIGPAAFLRQNAAISSRRDLRHVPGRLSAPVLVMNGALDRVCPTSIHDELMPTLSDGYRIVVPDAGHLVTIDQPVAASAALNTWLETCHNKQQQEGNPHESIPA